jgi:glycine C-acetyltransferase
LDYLSIQERIGILNSWLSDNNRKHMVFNRRIVETGCKTFSKVKNAITREEQELLNLSSNDYLKLTQHPKIKNAVIEAIKKYGLGAGTASLATGTTRMHRQLEEKIAAFKGCEDSLVQSSGYATNIGVISSLLGEKDIGIFDSYAHASLLDGMTLAGTNKVFFLHNDMDSLESMLKRTQKDYVNRMVIVEGLYSMDGDIAPLDKVTELAHKYNAWLLVDDAHATGVLGKNGKGTIELFDLEGQIDIVTGTFSKSIGGVGGFVAGTSDLINYLRLSSRSYIFSAAAFIPTVVAAYEAFKIIEEDSELRDKLRANTRYMHQKLKEAGFNIGETQSCIFPVYIGDNKKVLELTQGLQNYGYLVNAVLYPAVPKDRSRIRFAVTTDNTIEQLDKFLDCLNKLSKELLIV